MMRNVAAAPLVLDDPLEDPPIASPELALVDADLAAQLRADMSTGDEFRPRPAARPEYPSLILDADVRDLVEDEPSGGEPEELDGRPDYIVVSDDAISDVLLEVPEASAGDEHSSLESPALLDLDERSDELDELPDYILQSDDVLAEVVPEYLVPPADETTDDVLDRDLVFVPDVAGEATVQQAEASSDYPALPDLDERSDALEETEVALRRIREQMGVATPEKRKPRVRRRFIIGSGFCAVAALGVYVAGVQLGVAHLHGLLAF